MDILTNCQSDISSNKRVTLKYHETEIVGLTELSSRAICFKQIINTFQLPQ